MIWGYPIYGNHQMRQPESLQSSVLVCLLDPLDKLRVFDLKLMKVLTKMQKCQQPLIWVCLKIVYPYTQWFV